MVEIISLSSIRDPEDYQSAIMQVKDIFYMSSSLKEFSSDERKASFFKRWCGDYIEYFPEFFLLMIEDKKVLGYLSGCLDSKGSESVLEVPGFSVFSDQFEDFPAHFHINFHSDCRGLGLGSVLVSSFCDQLLAAGIGGVHLVTSPGAQNISFYKRSGFLHEVPREFKKMDLLFMGKKMS